MVFKQIEHIGKKFLVFILGLFLKQEKLTPEEVDLSSIKKILVIRQDDRIGNLILTTPLLSALRKSFPQAHISYLASKTFHTLFYNSSLVDQIFVAKKRQYIFHPLSLVFFIRKIRKQRFDLAFDASDENSFSLNNSFLAYLCGAKYRIGYKKPHSDLFLNLEVPSLPLQRHATEMHLELLRFLVGDFEGSDLKIEVDPENRLSVKKYLKEKGILPDDFLIGINLGGRGKKRLDLDNFTRLADWLIDDFDAKVIFIWGPEEKKIIIRRIRLRRKGLTLKNENKQILSDLFPLPVLVALIKRCNLFISGDTGAMHLSTAVGTPTLALFLDSDPVKFGPRGKNHKIICSSNGKISVETVKEATKEMMETRVLVKEKA
ncbi:MAG: glycosyltransferase family 9 protein [candidate division Zixibacteria bacterium]|nr:glycosyltransferase family 9 protein [candidate division Zixibacteria bacterium]